MRKLAIFVTAIFVLASFGCPVRSFFPLFEKGDKSVVFRPELVGTWVSEKEAADPDAQTLTIRRAGATDGYLIEVPSGHEGDRAIITTYQALLGRIGEAWFLQTRQQVHGDETDHLVLAFLIHRIWLEGGKFRASSLDAEWLEKMIGNKTLEVAHVVNEDVFLLTAEPPALKKLVRQFSDDPEAFPEPETFIRKK